tara:strand:+ start:5818 stop:7383 length:1566 start_codon:yes stop_codon:yes gene_type:complete
MSIFCILTFGFANSYTDCAGTPGGDAVEDCAGVCGGYAMEDDCGVCSSNYYCYDYVTHQTNTDFPCDGPTEMLVLPNSSYNQDWNASCDLTPQYSSFTWDYFTNNSGGPNYPTNCEDINTENCESVELITLNGGMITSSGNLYGISNPLLININSGYSTIESIDLTLSTLGTVLNYSATSLEVSNEVILPSYEILSNEPDDWGGASVTVKFSWTDLSEYDLQNGWSIQFEASGAHMSLDQVILEWNANNAVVDCCEIINGDNSSCAGSGDLDGDGTVTINDIIITIAHILATSPLSGCDINTADVDNNGSVNIMDVIAQVDIALSGGLSRANSSLQKANSVTLIQTAEGLSYEADGFVGFEIILSHGVNFEINMTKSGFIASSNTVGTTTKIVVVNNETSELFTSVGNFEIVDVIAGTIGGNALQTDVLYQEIPKTFGLSKAYPNPFNPKTSIDFTMLNSENASIEIYNMLGQKISTLHEGYLSADTYSFTWNAQDFSSGMYIVKAQSEGNISTQKIMLMK